MDLVKFLGARHGKLNKKEAWTLLLSPPGGQGLVAQTRML